MLRWVFSGIHHFSIKTDLKFVDPSTVTSPKLSPMETSLNTSAPIGSPSWLGRSVLAAITLSALLRRRDGHESWLSASSNTRTLRLSMKTTKHFRRCSVRGIVWFFYVLYRWVGWGLVAWVLSSAFLSVHLWSCFLCLLFPIAFP